MSDEFLVQVLVGVSIVAAFALSLAGLLFWAIS